LREHRVRRAGPKSVDKSEQRLAKEEPLRVVGEHEGPASRDDGECRGGAQRELTGGTACMREN
jgi:hypothetical protein